MPVKGKKKTNENKADKKDVPPFPPPVIKLEDHLPYHKPIDPAKMEQPVTVATPTAWQKPVDPAALEKPITVGISQKKLEENVLAGKYNPMPFDENTRRPKITSDEIDALVGVGLTSENNKVRTNSMLALARISDLDGDLLSNYTEPMVKTAADVKNLGSTDEDVRNAALKLLVVVGNTQHRKEYVASVVSEMDDGKTRNKHIEMARLVMSNLGYAPRQRPIIH